MTLWKKEETDAAAIDVFSDGESADSVDTQTAKSVTASGAVMIMLHGLYMRTESW